MIKKLVDDSLTEEWSIGIDGLGQYWLPVRIVTGNNMVT